MNFSGKSSEKTSKGFTVESWNIKGETDQPADQHVTRPR